MKLSFAIFAATISSVAARYKSIPIAESGLSADSELGMKVLSKARLLEGDDDNGEVDMTWVAGYSLKFQGCHHVQQWNDEADDEEDVRIQTKRLVRFRLCPSGTCSETKAAGCTGGHGDYIIDLNIFVEAYFEATRQLSEYECENYYENNCNCEDDDGKGDDFDAEICEYDCYADAGLEKSCVDNNPYEDDENKDEEFEVERYMECENYEAPDDDDNNNRRRLDEEEEEQEFFIGPYCGEQGGSIFLGMFTDDACTEFADYNGGRDTYESLSGGDELPYSAASIIGPECVSCLNVEDNDNDNDQADNDSVMESCQEIYNAAGKCEESLPEGMIVDPNTNACNYIAGIKVIRQDGIITAIGSSANGTATVFIVIFALAAASLAFYVYYLRTRLGVKNNTLL